MKILKEMCNFLVMKSIRICIKAFLMEHACFLKISQLQTIIKYIY